MFSQKNGLIYKDILIDPQRSPKHDKVVLTHAHSDHVKLSKKATFFASPPTIDLVKKRYGDATFSPLEFGKKTPMGDFTLTAHPNGHILGSFQSHLSSDGVDSVVTSDFRLQDSLLFKGATPLPCETLVLETTFGTPEYVFPPYMEVVDDMVRWIKESAKSGLVLLAGYSLGKAQELTKIANMAGFAPVVHESIAEMNTIYEKHGVKLGDYVPLNHNLKESSVVIMPPQLVNRHLFATLEHFDKRKIYSAVASGWEHKGYFDKVFHLSDHADYNDLFSYVEQAHPKLVLTDHGFCEDFARKLNKKGFNAKPLGQHTQRIMSEF